MQRMWLRSRGSVLLVVLFLSSAVLVIFSTFYSVMHESVKARLEVNTDERLAIEAAVDAAKYNIPATLPDGIRLISHSQSGTNYEAMAYAGTPLTFMRIASGSISVTLLDGGPAKVLLDNGPLTASGVLFDSLALTASNTATGTISLATLGGYSKISIWPNTVVRPKTEIFTLEKDVANTTIELRTFEIHH